MKKEKQIRTGYYLIEILRNVLKDEKKVTKLPDDITVQGLYYLAKRHSIDCITYFGLSELLENDCGEIGEKWKKRNLQCAMQGIVQLAERDKLYKVFPENGIRILPLKGCLLKEMYPRQEFRQMADLDILIDDEKTMAVKNVMEDAGYESPENIGQTNHDAYEKKPWCSVEMHRELLHETLKNADKYSDIWERAYEEKEGSGIYRLSWDDFYIYMLEHFAKHLYSGGSGIRFVMDVYVFLDFLKNEKYEFDQEYLETQLKALELWEFRKLTEQLAENWFEKGIIGEFKEIEELIIVSGIYGTKEQNYRATIERLRKKYHSYGVARTIYVGEKVFLRYKQMCVLYPVLKKYPILLPLYWAYRIIKTIVKKRSEIKRMFSFMYRVEKAKKAEDIEQK